MFMDKISCEKLSYLWKISMTVENFLNCGKVFDYGKVSRLLKSSLAVEKFLNEGKFAFLSAENQ